MAKTTKLRSEEASPPRPGTPSRRRRWPVAVFLVVSMMASLAIAASAAYGFYLYRYADSEIGRLAKDSGEEKVIHDRHGQCARGTCTYLVMGNDSRKGLSPEEQAQFGSETTIPGQRSDTIMLVRLDARTRQAVVVSFPRDLWVRIPHQGMGKLTSAYEGGPVRVAQVVSRLTGLEINHFLSLNLAGFEHVVDAIGTIPICVAGPLVDPTGFSGLNLPQAGCYDLDGRQALAFVRARHICGEGGIPDFNRISRQQQFLRAVLARVLSPSMVLRAPQLISDVASNLLVDRTFNTADLIYLSRKLSGVQTGAVDIRTVPGNPYATRETPIGTQDVVTLLPDAKELFKRLREGRPLGNLGLATTQTPPSPAVIKVRVYDDASDGVATQVDSYLERSGFDIQPMAASNSLGVEGPVILFARTPAAKRAADVVHGFLTSIPEQPAPAGGLGGVDVAVVIPSTYDGVPVGSPQPTPSPGSTVPCG